MIAPHSGAKAYVGLGSNLDDPVRQVRRALLALDRIPFTRLVAQSRLYRSAPWGEVAQPDFVNAVAELDTQLEPRALLDAMLEIEVLAGRVRLERWGPRILDLDLLLYDDRQIDEPGLHVPHPRLAERAFVLLPLSEIAPAMQIAGIGSVADRVRALESADIEALAPEGPGSS